MDLEIREADLDDPAEGRALVALLDAYARGPGGQQAPIPEAARAALVPGLRALPTALTLLAFEDGSAVGAAVCVEGFSTFRGHPLLNVHDLVVEEAHRGRGIGTALLAEVERRARARGCGRITLEVHDRNEGAKRLYRRLGFGPWRPATLAVRKDL